MTSYYLEVVRLKGMELQKEKKEIRSETWLIRMQNLFGTVFFEFYINVFWAAQFPGPKITRDKKGDLKQSSPAENCVKL